MINNNSLIPSSTKYQLDDISVEINDDIRAYADIVLRYSENGERFLDEIKNLIAENESITKIIEVGATYIDSIINSAISELAEKGIYAVAQSELKETNKGYVEWITAINEYLNIAEETNKAIRGATDQQKVSALNEANAMIQGPGFGVISNDILSLITYDLVSSSAIKEQTKKAENYYNHQSFMIEQWGNNQHKAVMRQYLQGQFRDQVLIAIPDFTNYIIAEIVRNETRNGVINFDNLGTIQQGKSIEILQNINVVPDKRKLVYTAIQLCPFNSDAFYYAYKYGFFSDILVKLAIDIGLKRKVTERIAIENNICNGSQQSPSSLRGREEVISLISKIEENDERKIYIENLQCWWNSVLEKIGQLITLNSTGRVISFFKDHGVSESKNINLNFINSYIKSEIICEQDFDYIKVHTGDALLSDLQRKGLDSSSYTAFLNSLISFLEAIVKQSADVLKDSELEEERIREENDLQKKRRRKRTNSIITALLVFAVLAFLGVKVYGLISLENKYQNAKKLFQSGDYDSSSVLYKELGNYKDSAEMVGESYYSKAMMKLDEGDYNSARAIISEVKDGRDTSYIYFQADYLEAVDALKQKDYETAITQFTELGNFGDSENKVKESKYGLAQRYIAEGNLENAILLLDEIREYGDAQSLLISVVDSRANELLDQDKYEEAIKTYRIIAGDDDTEEKIQAIRYQQAIYLSSKGKHAVALTLFQNLGDYKDSSSKLVQERYAYAKKIMETNAVEARKIFFELGTYLDSANLAAECDYLAIVQYIKAGSYDKAVSELNTIQYDSEDEEAAENRYQIATMLIKQGQYEKAADIFKELNNYKDSSSMSMECVYLRAKNLINNFNYANAKELFLTINDYKDSKTYISYIDSLVDAVYYCDDMASNRLWVVTTIDTTNCEKTFITYIGRSYDYAKYKITMMLFQDSTQMKYWKTENGKVFVSSKGIDPQETGLSYRIWNIAGDWSSIYSESYGAFGDNLGFPTQWKRMNDEDAQLTREGFINYRRENASDCAGSDWRPAQAAYERNK